MMSLEEREFWKKVQVTANSDECWLWVGGLNKKGYGQLWNKTLKRMQGAHRFAYEHSVGPIPEGLVLDHRCRVRNCVNPAHLWPVTNRDNLFAPGSESISVRNAAKTHCPNGHPYSGENLYRSPKGGRVCRACIYFRQKAYRIKKKGTLVYVEASR